MEITRFLIQTAVTFVAAGLGAILGAILGAFLTRRTERFKHLQELRSAAYAIAFAGLQEWAEHGVTVNQMREAGLRNLRAE